MKILPSGSMAVAIVATVSFAAACTPSSPPATSTTTTTTTTTSTTTTTGVPSAPLSCAVDFVGDAGPAVAPTADEPQAPLDLSSVADSDADELTLTLVDETGRPEIHTLDADVARAFAAVLDDVVAIEEPVAVRPLAGDPGRHLLWGLDAVGFDEIDHCTTGHGAHVAIIDTGVNIGHEDLVGAVSAGPAIIDGVPLPGGGGEDVATNNHGTHVAGTIAAIAGNGIGIAGAAPGAAVTSIRTFDAPEGNMNDVAKGIVEAVDLGADVVNLSVGGGSTHSLVAAVEYATANNVILVAAAGNLGSNGEPVCEPCYPAALPDVISVASHTESLKHSSFSVTADHLDVAAPGSAILSTTGESTYHYLSGTSMAAPHVTALVARMKAVDAELGVGHVRAALTSTAHDIDDPGYDHRTGHGAVDAIELWARHRTD